MQGSDDSFIGEPFVTENGLIKLSPETAEGLHIARMLG
jgi:hypothetical protein